jgi:hypothetical protein
MEKMVSDPSITNVLIFSDKSYAEKADARKAGVGTESQIISKEIYDKIDQKKFIPIACERNEHGEPFFPVFLKSRISIDFSTPEAVNDNWERLLRVLFGKPSVEKPALGKPPSYLTEDTGRPSLPTIGKFASLRDALINQKPAIDYYRKDFLEAAISFADALRVREDPRVEHIDEKVLEDLHKLLPLRDQFIDWLLLEAAIQEPPRLEIILTEFLERILAMKYRPPEVQGIFDEAWFDAHGIFVYEMFLYLIAILIKAEKDNNIRIVLTTPYILPESEVVRRDFVQYDEFYAYSKALNQYRNKRLKANKLSLLAEVIKERATRRDIQFGDIMQADLILFLVGLLSDNVWYPQTLVYAEWGQRFPLFIRAAHRKYFGRLRTITGVKSGDELRQEFKEKYEKCKVSQWTLVINARLRFWELMNMDALDTIA